VIDFISIIVSNINYEIKFSIMKKAGIGIGIIQFILLIVLLFIIVSLSACNLSGNVSMKGKGLMVKQLKELKAPIEVSDISDTSHKEQLTGDFRYDYLLK
jgi:hypothetical protein